MTKIKLTAGALVVAGIAAVGYALHKGWIKLPNILGLLPGDVGRGAQEVPGIPGAVGGAVYNILAPGDTTPKERADIRVPSIAAAEDIPPEVAFDKALAQEVASDVEKGPFGTGFIGAILPPLSGYTIGAGLGAMDRWNRYLNALPEDKKAAARMVEYEDRAAWMYAHPIESVIGFPAQIIHEATKPEGAPSAPIAEVAKIIVSGTPILNPLNLLPTIIKQIQKAPTPAPVPIGVDSMAERIAELRSKLPPLFATPAELRALEAKLPPPPSPPAAPTHAAPTPAAPTPAPTVLPHIIAIVPSIPEPPTTQTEILKPMITTIMPGLGKFFR